jgi:Family of unknown function (DUF5681)
MPGYRDPPMHSRFRSGTSGNPAGRPKATRALADLLAERVPIVKNGKRQTVAMFEAQLLAQVQRALKGDIKAAQLVLRIFEKEGVSAWGSRPAEWVRIPRSDNLPEPLRRLLLRRFEEGVSTIHELNAARGLYFQRAPEIERIREELNCYTDTETFRSHLVVLTGRARVST